MAATKVLAPKEALEVDDEIAHIFPSSSFNLLLYLFLSFLPSFRDNSTELSSFLLNLFDFLHLSSSSSPDQRLFWAFNFLAALLLYRLSSDRGPILIEDTSVNCFSVRSNHDWEIQPLVVTDGEFRG